MAKSRKLLLAAGAANLRGRALGAVRPSVEALLLAAVALGCAQAGWSVLTPGTAGALNATTDTDQDAHRIDVSEVVSPFAPTYLESDAQSHAVAALLSGVQLSGVRMSSDDLSSGAILTLNDGAQKAFAVGQEISSGVTLAEVGADYVLVSYPGGQRQISMSTAPTFSFARAMMGLDQAPGAPIPPEQGVFVVAETAETIAPEAPASISAEAQSPVADAAFNVQSVFAEVAPEPAGAAAPAASAEELGWLQATLAQTQTENGQASGWRVAEPLPQTAIDAGLQGGDVIVAVNGAGPADTAGIALAAAQSQTFELAVVRGGQRLTLTIEARERT